MDEEWRVRNEQEMRSEMGKAGYLRTANQLMIESGWLGWVV